MKATEISNAHFRILAFSDYGGGKTHLIGEMHEKLKLLGTRGIYMFDFDLGFNTLKSAGFDVELDLYAGEDAFSRFIDRMTSLEYDDEGFGGIAIDSLTLMQNRAMKRVFQIKPDGSRQLGGIVPNRNDQGLLVNIMSQIFPQLLAFGMSHDIIVTAHVREFQSELTGELKRLPAIVGASLPSQIGCYFNEVWRLVPELTSDNVVIRRAQTASADRFACKTQVKGMPFLPLTSEALDYCFQAYRTGEIISLKEADAASKIALTEEEKLLAAQRLETLESNY